MGKLKELQDSVVGSLMCGLSYQKFDTSEQNLCQQSTSSVVQHRRSASDPASFVRTNPREYFCYNCSECGHRGTIKVRIRLEFIYLQALDIISHTVDLDFRVWILTSTLNGLRLPPLHCNDVDFAS